MSHDRDDDERVALIQRLSDAIQEAIAGSEEVLATLGEVEGRGYELTLSLFMALVLEPRGSQDESMTLDVADSSTSSTDLLFEFNSSDLDFLRSVGITMPDEDEPSASGI